jgi:hypothetical protein
MKSRYLLVLPAIFIAMACEGTKDVTGIIQADGNVSHVITDGAHCATDPANCNRDFFFLPPLVPIPLHNPDFELGKFNNALRPSLKVEICKLAVEPAPGLPKANTVCVQTVKTFAPGSVQVVNLPNSHTGWWTVFGLPADGFYYVLWDTKQMSPRLDATRYYRIKVSIDGSSTILGYADIDPIQNLTEWKNALTGQVIQMLNGTLLPIPFRVERGALCDLGATCNSATISNNSGSPNVSQSVTVDAGGGSIAGASFPNGWLPAPNSPGCTPETCPQSVVVTITEVPTSQSGVGSGGAEPTICHPGLDPKFEQFRGCFNYSTTPKLRAINDAGDQFAQPVTVAVCYELEGSGDGREKFAQLYSSDFPAEAPRALDDIPDGGLLGANSRDCSTTPPVALGNPSPLVRLASTAWRKVKGGLGQVFGVKTAYAIDQGLGGIVKGFSNISPVLVVDLRAASPTSVTLPQGQLSTTVQAKIVAHHFHTLAVAPGVNDVPVTFTLTGESNATIQPVTGAGPGTAGPVIVKTAPATTGVSENGIASVTWTFPGPGTYTMTADGPASGGPVVFTATVPANAPDLVISSGPPSVNPTTMSASGGTLRLSSWTATNQGGNFQTELGALQVGVYVSPDATITPDDIQIRTATITDDALQAGESSSRAEEFAVVPALAPGRYYIGILVDRTGAVAESNETNNFVSAQVLDVVSSRTMLSMQTGATFQIPVVAPEAVATWLSTNSTDVSVSADGLVTAIAGGEDPDGLHGANVKSVLTTQLAGPMALVNTVFDIFPRTTTLLWRPVSGAATYEVEAQFGNGCTGFARCNSWQGNGSGNSAAVTSYTLDFVGAQPGRWRVTARDPSGNIIPGDVDAAGVPIPNSPSPWVYFRYDR